MRAQVLLAVILMNLRSLPARWAPALVAVVGIGGVVMVLTATLAIAQGFRQALATTGATDVAVVVRGGSSGELASNLLAAEAHVIEDAPGVMRDAAGALASPEMYVLVDLPMVGSGTAANVPFRGIGPRGRDLRKHFRLTAGRMFTPGLFEVIVGRGAAAGFRGLTLGSTVRFGTQRWQVVGFFEDGGSVTESELWADIEVLKGAYRRTAVQSVRLALGDPSALARIEAALAADPRVNVAVTTEREFYAAQSRSLITLVTVLGSTISLLMGVGAVFGALNTMYSAVAARTREIATLRALGFGGTAVLASVMTEALLLGLAGGVLGAIAAWVAFDGTRASTLNFQTFSQLTFAFVVSPRVVVVGVLYALGLGFVGGFWPALRAARMSIVEGLRSL